ncbi:Mu transposase-like protein [Paraburkholderia sp. BL23I1N1]|uniref:Mu transposase C-terminal domain-containing protein n=1 Tax=Paraburkholderia sp. BL23I1N1 TaxID=1938802 RepID=UPI000E72DABC|nr:Mu transposase C-terminal domain-containing protein [Paraburkholderia sp. BL23I1N1]RKE38689.1 Mu transposase-like protein [Paraburkholderia sp. BL23I1N1]
MERISADMLDALLKRQCVTKRGIDLVHSIREGEPLEPKPRVRAGRMRGEHISPLMGFAVRLNDVTLQSALLHELDDPQAACLEYYSWPTEFGGIRYGVSHGTRIQVDVIRPFLLKITDQWCGFIDVFSTSMMKKSAMSGNTLYEEVDEGHWTCPAVIDRLSQYGLRYEIVTEKHFGPWYLLNMGLLSPYRQPDYKIRDAAACAVVVAMVKDRGYVTRRELIERQLIYPDDLNYLIVTRRVFFPLQSQDVTDMRSSAVYRDATAYDVVKAAKAASDGFLSLDTAGKERSADTTSNHEPDFIQLVSPEAYDHARHKMTTLSEPISYWWPGSGPAREGKPIPSSTKALWRSKAESGRVLYGNAIYGLIPLWHERGSRIKRFPQSERLWDHVFLKYRLKKRWSIRATHGMFSTLALRLGLPFFSERTAKTRDKEYDRSIFVQFRDGSAARYAVAGFTRPGAANRLYQAGVPLFLAHIDHTPLGIKIENSANGRRFKCQVWLSVMIDAATGRKLAWTISFGAPSAAAVATVLFECIDRHGCLPRFIVVDNAPEFDSIVMHRILQEAESHLLWRPAYHPRYGAPVEAANHKITVQVLQMLAGNTVAVKSLYDYSRTFIARNPELMTLTQLNAYLKGVFDEVEMEVGSAKTGDESIRDYEARIATEVGTEHRKSIELTLAFRRLCMPRASNEGRRTVRDEGYVVVNNLAYFSEDLKRFRGQTVHVSPDLIHPGLVYIYVSKEIGWIDAKSIFTDFFALYSRRELLGVLAELKLGRLRGVRDPAFIARALAEKLLELERDPARCDYLARQMDSLMNRAPSLLKTEPGSSSYFNAPPTVGADAMAGVTADTVAQECAKPPCTAERVVSTEAAIAGGAASQAEGEAVDAEVVNAATGDSHTDVLDGGKNDEDWEIKVRPSRLSF